jgi:hypothetical protein
VIEVSSFSLLLKGSEQLASLGEEILARARMWLKNWPRFCEDAGAWIRRNANRIPGVAWHSYFLPKVVLGVFSLVLLVVILFAVRLSLGSIPIDSFAPRIANAIGERIGHGYEFNIGRMAIAFDGVVPVLSIDELSAKEPTGRNILTAPRAEISVGPLALMAGRVSLKRLEIYDVELRLALRPNGSLALPVSPEIGDAVDLTPPLRSPGSPDGALLSSPEAPPALRGDTGELHRVPPESQFAAMLRLAIDTLTSPDSVTAAIRHIGITRGKIIVDDETASQKLVFNGVNLGFDRSSRSTRFDLSVDGPNGRWRAFGAASGTEGLERSLTLSVANLSLDELLLAAGTRTIGVDFDMPLSGDLDIRLGADGMISQAAGKFESGSGYFRFDDPDGEPTMIDRVGGGFHWNEARRRIVIDRLQMAAGATHFGGSGSVAPPARDGDPWSIQLANTEPNVWGAERLGENPILIDLTDLAARLYLTEKKLAIDRFSFSGPQCGLALAGTIDWVAGPHVRLGASISPTPVKTVARLWPSLIAASVRSYLLSHASEGTVESGTVQIDFDAADLRAIREEHAPADAKAVVEFEIKNASLAFLPGVPPLRGIDGIGHITGRTATFTVSNAAIDSGNGRVLTLWDGSFRVDDTDLKPVPAVARGKVMGSVEAIGELLSHDALKPYASLPLDSSTLKGEANGTLEIDMRLGANTGPSDTNLKIDALASNLTAERLIGNENLEAATLTVNVDPTGLRASGQGAMFGAPATVSIEKLAGKPAEASIGMNIDDAMRAKLGIGALSGVSGPIGAKITAPLGTGEKPKAKIELDLSAVAIEIPGISKPAGQPGKISFAVAVNDASTSLDQIIVDAGPVQGHGKMELGTGFSLITASFPQVRLSSGDELRVDATGAGDTLKVVVRGSSIDARPFLKSLIFDPPGGAKAETTTGEERDKAGQGKDTGQGKEIEFDVKSDTLTGHNKQMIAGAELRFAKRGSQIKQFTFSGTFGGEQISSNLIGGGSAPRLTLVCDDAGSLLSFLDLYNHMEHGRLSVGLLLEPDALTGILVINNFVLRDEPALRRLVAEGTPQSDTSGREKRIDTSAVAFNKLQVRFRRDGSRLALSEGTMNGDAIGLTVEGAVDYVHDIVDMRGTFVPVYSVNNMFAKIPIVGPILGGRSEEGLIGVNYRISGQASAPTLSINPLSAIAPGIFRQIFGVVDFDPMNPQR